MADNVTFQATAATPPNGTIVATDNIGGVDFQRVKVTWGADGTATDASASAPLPVVQTGTPALPSGAATEATLDARTGSMTETAPATDTASSGLNGRLQRIAQRLTSLIALLPAALGAGGGLKVDGSGTALPVSQSGTWTVQPGNTANTTAWKVDGSAVTQPVSTQGNASGLLTHTGVATTATALPTSALSSRKLVRVTNPPTPYGYQTPIYVGYANTVVAGVSAAAGSAGRMIMPGQTVDFVVQSGQVLYGITTTQTQVAQIEEFA